MIGLVRVAATCASVGLLAVGIVAVAPAAQAAGPCDEPVVNPIVCENSKAGSPEAEWLGDASTSIEGFATDMSVNAGATIAFKVATDATDYRIDIYRHGWYGGAGARKVATIQPSAALPQAQPACQGDGPPSTSSDVGLVDCGNWAVSATWAVPADAVSGVYRALLVREDGTTGSNRIPFVVRNDGSTSDIVVQTSDTTWQAYNEWGNVSLYKEPIRSKKVSYNRPWKLGAVVFSSFEESEFAFVRWLERNGYDVSYISGVDTDRAGATLVDPSKHKVFMSSGHDEYWSGPQRAHVEAARDAGMHMAFFSGNEVYWRTRWEPSAASGTSTSHRTLVCYKESKPGATPDPSPEWTGTWQDPRFFRPTNTLTGQQFAMNGVVFDPMTVPADLGKARLWRNTSVASLAPGDQATFAAGILGMEWDTVPYNGVQPPGLARFSDTSIFSAGLTVQDDAGVLEGPGTARHALSLYRAASGALVFGAGTTQWSWGLDEWHSRTTVVPVPADDRMRQATVNLFADMGVQPGSLQGGLVLASPSTDSTPPVSTITSPADGARLTGPDSVTVTGTASDVGGVVTSVEISTDDGQTWDHATGTTSWSYSFVPKTTGPHIVRVRAVDDSANLQSSGPSIRLRTSCPCTVFGSAVPTTAAEIDTDPIEVGTRFTVSSPGLVSGVRFYKGPGNTGTHVGRLWNQTSGRLLGEVSFTDETATGWQTAQFPTPLAVVPGQTYVVGYHTSTGRFSATRGVFGRTITRGIVTATAGLFRYGVVGSSVPDQSVGNSNYHVDVVIPDATAPVVVSRSPGVGVSGVARESTVRVTFDESVVVGEAAVSVAAAGGAVVAGAVAWSVDDTVMTFTPSAALAYGTSYGVTVSGVRDAAGNAAAPVSWSFSTLPAPDVTPPVVVSRSPGVGVSGVARESVVQVGFDEPLAAGYAVAVAPSGGAPVAGAVSLDASGRVLTFVPSVALAYGTSYGVTVSGVRDAAGNAAGPVSWSFTTLPAPDVTVPVVSTAALPAVVVGPPVMRWTATDDAGVVAVRLRVRTAPAGGRLGAWRDLATLPGAATSYRFSRVSAGGLCVEVTAVDAAGLVSSPSVRCTTVPLDDRSLVASRGGWTRATTPGTYLRSSSVSTRAGAWLSRSRVYGSRVTLLVARAPGAGTVGVWVNNRLVGTVSLAAARPAVQQQVSLRTGRMTNATVVVKTITPRRGVSIDALAVSP